LTAEQKAGIASGFLSGLVSCAQGCPQCVYDLLVLMTGLQGKCELQGEIDAETSGSVSLLASALEEQIPEGTSSAVVVLALATVLSGLGHDAGGEEENGGPTRH
jgi:hypothetical protein